jgi:hypothetical protein
MSNPELITEKPMTQAEKEQAEIEALEMHRNAALMTAAAYEKQLEARGRKYKKKPNIDKH